MQHAIIKASVHYRTEWGVDGNQTPYFQRCSCNSRHWSECCIDSNHGGQLVGHFSTNDTITTSERHQTNPAWRYGLELGIYMFLGYAFHAIGLETTSASRSGFLLYFNLNFKLVPFFSFLIFGKPIHASTCLLALMAFGGTALLDNSNTSHRVSLGLNVDDVRICCCLVQ